MPRPRPSRALLGPLAAAFALLALGAGPALADGGLFVGAADDGAKSLDPVRVKRKVDLGAAAGLGTLRMSIIWSPGQTAVGGDDLRVLRNAATAAQLDGVRLIVSVYQRDHRTTPLHSRARGEFAEFTASIARAVPSVRDFVIGNEPNLNLFWMPQYGRRGVDLAAGAYVLLLARTYDALKSVSPEINVIGGALAPSGRDEPSARATHSPTAFIRDMGAAYRRSHRKKPLMDMFALHPYVIPSRLPPTFAHPRTTTISIADYPKLVGLLRQAFRGTRQRGATLPIVYDEFGYQSQIPRRKASRYTHLKAKVAQDAIPEARQAAYYRQAFALAACQPTVAGILIFHVADERDARAWQSGLYYSDGTAKSSLRAVRAAAVAAQAGTLACRDLARGPLESVSFREPSADGTQPFAVDVSCSVPCLYRAEVLEADTGAVVAAASGDAFGDATVPVAVPPLPASTYQYALRVFAAGRPGTAVTRFSRPFAAGTVAVPADGSTGPHDPPAPVEPAPFPDWTPSVRLPSAPVPLPTLLATVAPPAPPSPPTDPPAPPQ